MLKTLTRPVLILLAFAAGYLVPQAAPLVFLIRYLLLVMLYFIFLQVRAKGLKPRGTHWRLLAANIGVGLAAWGVTLLTGNRALAHAAFFTGITPTASAAPVIIRFLGGSVEFVVTAFLVCNIGVSLSLTGLIPLVTGNFTASFLLDVAGSLLFIVGLPMGLAALTRRIYPASKEWPPKLANFSFALWVVMLFLTASNASAFIRETPDLSSTVLLEIAGISALICILNFTLGYFISAKRCRRESSQSLGQKNTMFTLYLAMTYAGPLAALGPTFYVLWHNLWNAAQMFMHDRKKHLRKNRVCRPCENRGTGYIETKRHNPE